MTAPVADAVLAGFGLLRPGSVVSHANHISGADVDVLGRRQAGVDVAFTPDERRVGDALLR